MNLMQSISLVLVRISQSVSKVDITGLRAIFYENRYPMSDMERNEITTSKSSFTRVVVETSRYKMLIYRCL